MSPVRSRMFIAGQPLGVHIAFALVIAAPIPVNRGMHLMLHTSKVSDGLRSRRRAVPYLPSTRLYSFSSMRLTFER